MRYENKKADKLVAKATTVFGNAIDQVKKANELLKSDIEDSKKTIADSEIEIQKKQEIIAIQTDVIGTKEEQIKSNDELIEKLNNFAPQQ